MNERVFPKPAKVMDMSETLVCEVQPKGFLNPYLQLSVKGLLVAASGLPPKRGATATIQVSGSPWAE
jgi:hypothetical protein